MNKLFISLIFFLAANQLLAQLPSNSPPLINQKKDFSIYAFVAGPNTHPDVGIAYALTDRFSLSAKFLITNKNNQKEYSIGMSSLSLRYYRSKTDVAIYGASFDIGLGNYQWPGNSLISGVGPVFTSNGTGETTAKSLYANLSIYGGLQLNKFMFIASFGGNRNDYFDINGDTFQFSKSLKSELQNADRSFYSLDYGFAVRYGIRKTALEVSVRNMYEAGDPALNGFFGIGAHINLQGKFRRDRNDG